jgi:hypothetical protein
MPAITYTWTIAQMDRSLPAGMVQTLHWTVSAADGDHTASAYGSIGLEPADPLTMVPFEDLTPELVIGWLKDQLGDQVASIEDALAGQIADQKTPKQASGLPWA